ncbi:MAG: hypothetical protein JSS53_02815, partial [Proteobacteria bacterium]|nr:hypothetical protein [Pseudomonadota bacterium]
LLKKAGLIPKIVDIESYAMERAIHFLGHEFEKLEIRQSDGEIFYRDLKAWMISFGLALRQFDGERDEFNSY